jgi:hypothetical protein
MLYANNAIEHVLVVSAHAPSVLAIARVLQRDPLHSWGNKQLPLGMVSR